MEIHFIPTQDDVQKNPLYSEMAARGSTIHNAFDWSVIPDGAPVISFCNQEFLNSLPEIRQRSRRTIFVNCMTWLFGKEKEAMQRGDIALFLYQNENVKTNLMPRLKALNDDANIRFMSFRPYFDDAAFPFMGKRLSDWFGAGHISRQEDDKFSKDILKIYEYFSSPIEKRGFFLGFDARSQAKTGEPPAWIETYHDHNDLSQQEFYHRCHIILQPTDTTENWPRIGFEAMASGSVLIVDKRGGWEQMIEHGKTGWLCENTGDFIAYASKMAWEPHLREDIAAAARERGRKLGGMEASLESWEEVFYSLDQLPE